jgi:hypothetical protein
VPGIVQHPRLLQKKLPSQVIDPVDTAADGGCCIGV